MGRSKALLDAGGAPFLARAVACLLHGGCTGVSVVVRDPSGPEGILALGLGAVVLENADPAAGPISSVRVALDELRRRNRDGGAAPDAVQGIALLPVDHPEVRPATVRALLDAAEEVCHRGAGSGPGPGIILPRHGEHRGHPALFLAPVWDELLDETLAGGARTVVRRDPGRVLEVAVEDPGIHLDIDRPEEYREHFPADGAVHG